DRNRIDGRVAQERAHVGRRLHRRVALRNVREAIGAKIARHRHLGAVGAGEIAQQIRTPVSETDDADTNHRVTCRSTFAGTPATMARSGTSRVTTAPAPTIACAP